LQWLIVFLVLLSLPTLACGLLGGEEAPTEVPATEAPAEEEVEEEVIEATDTPEPAEAPTETPEPAAEAPELGDLSDLGSTLENFESYRLSVVMSFTGEGSDAQEAGVNIETARVSDPLSSRTTISLRGQMVEEAGGMDSLSIAEVEDQVFMVLPGMGCVAGSGDELGGATDEFSDIFDTEDLLGEVDGAEFVGEEEVNGVDVYHYRFDETNVESSENELRELEGDVFIAQDGNYVVRMVVDGVGTMDLFDEGADEEGTVHLEYNVTDVGADIEIEIPEGCEETGSEFPMMEDAANQASFGGFTSYETAASVDEVVAFYEEEMAALGYEAGEDQFIAEDTAILSFVQEGMPEISVTINQEDDTTSVLIASEADGG
jgi:hypothetical protein